jgi:hypothetical protein
MQEIHRVPNELDKAMCNRVMVNFMERIIACRVSKEDDLADIIFQCKTFTSPEENSKLNVFFKRNKFNL